MLTITEILATSPIIWVSASNGSPGGLGTGTVNIDTTTGATEQDLSQTFTIGPAPANSPDGLWDTVSFDVTYTHVNNRASGAADQDVGRFYIRILPLDGTRDDGERISIMPEDGPTGTFTGTMKVTFSNIPPGNYRLFVGEVNSGDGEALRVSATNGTATETVPCFAAGTLIETESGETPIEGLKVGDLVRTRDRGLRPLRWIGSRRLSRRVLNAAPNLRPILIRAGAICVNTPHTDLLVSPQHRVLVRSAIARRMFSMNEVLIPAKHLCGIDGIAVADDVVEIVYFHLLFDQHEVVISNGAETESLYTGVQALKSLGPVARSEIFTLFPELRDKDGWTPPRAARPLSKGRKARRLVSRHVSNGRYLVG